MKRIILVTLTILSFSVAAFAINSTIDIKGGIQDPKGPDKIGFDSAVTLNIGLDKYFTAGVESGFGWLNWTEKVGSVIGGNLPLTKTADTNAYTLPLLAVGKIRLADMMDQYGFMPYITGGAGYSWTWYRNPQFNDRFGGFTWQAMGGIEAKLGADSNLAFVIEAGYRGAKVKDSNSYELDMSGFIGRIGVSIPIETSN